MKCKDIGEAQIRQTVPPGPHAWIQWKGTNVCMDIHCKCGAHGHIDTDFAYHVKCRDCGTVYYCNGHIELIELEVEPEHCVELFWDDE